MTKKEIVKLISDKFDEPQVKVKDIVQETFDLIVKALVKEGRIELRNFGVFEVKRRKSRRARNPRTNESVEVPAKNVVTFQPGKVMEEQVKHAEKVVEPKRKQTKYAKATAGKPTTPAPATGSDDEEGETVRVGGGAGASHADMPSSPNLPLKPR